MLHRFYNMLHKKHNINKKKYILCFCFDSLQQCLWKSCKNKNSNRNFKWNCDWKKADSMPQRFSWLLNTEYIRFWKFNEYRIIRFLKINRIPNTNSTIRTQLFEYRILNNEYWKLNDAHCHWFFFHKLNLR